MGCTSSAPKMSPSVTNSENYLAPDEIGEKILEETKKAILAKKENESNAIYVLPTSDIVEGTTQLARNKSNVDMANSVQEKDSHANGYVVEGDSVATTNNTEMPENIESEKNSDEKFSSLEEVVEKVVELYVTDAVSEIPDSEKENVETKEENAEKGDAGDNLNEEQSDKTEDIEEKEVLEEIASPSQSESSRATRWEALADIAAELPPSLAVDPITGQIYTLTK